MIPTMSPTSALEAMHELLQAMPVKEASDLHLVPGHPPIYRVHGRLSSIEGPPLTSESVRALLESVVPERIRLQIADRNDVDCSISMESNSHGPGAGRSTLRFRANIFCARGQLCACLRFIAHRVPSFDWLGFPMVLADRILQLTSGLVIITGITGSGKTTTLAALVQMLIQKNGCRVLTIEEPIEYLLPSAPGSLVTQREVGVDVDSFYDGLKYGLRQDPDVILVGEIRDRNTAQMAISAAETGHLILTTLHTQDAKGAITRMVDLFPVDTQDDVRTQLSLSFKYVISQHLLPPATPGEKRALALEVLANSHSVAAAIRQGRIESLESAIQTGRKAGMINLDESLTELMQAGKITRETARRYAKDTTLF
jgi:twitching motility protein PilT